MDHVELEHVRGKVRFEIVDERDAGASGRRFDADADPSEAHDAILTLRTSLPSEAERAELLERLEGTMFGPDVVVVHSDGVPSALRLRLIAGSAKLEEPADPGGATAWPIAFRAKLVR
jgi:hypothetical protein